MQYANWKKYSFLLLISKIVISLLISWFLSSEPDLRGSSASSFPSVVQHSQEYKAREENESKEGQD